MKNWLEIPLNKLRRAAWNYKTDDSELMDKFRENIKRNGQVQNMIVRELPGGLFEVVNGNHRLDVFQELGFKKAICFNKGNISLEDAMALAIETNETRFATDPVKLAGIIEEICLEFDPTELSQTLPYSQEDIEAYRDARDYINRQKNKQSGQSHAADPKPKTKTQAPCPYCHQDIILINGKIKK